MEVWTSDNHAVGAGFSVDLDRWQDEFDKLMLRIGSRFARVDRGGGRRPSSGPAGGLQRVGCWSIAEHAGDADQRGCSGCCRPRYGMGPGAGTICAAIYWSTSLTRPRSGWRRDGDLKRVPKTADAQRQYTGTAGRTGNAQFAVYLAYAAPAGCAFIDRALVPAAALD